MAPWLCPVATTGFGKNNLSHYAFFFLFNGLSCCVFASCFMLLKKPSPSELSWCELGRCQLQRRLPCVRHNGIRKHSARSAQNAKMRLKQLDSNVSLQKSWPVQPKILRRPCCKQLRVGTISSPRNYSVSLHRGKPTSPRDLPPGWAVTLASLSTETVYGYNVSHVASWQLVGCCFPSVLTLTDRSCAMFRILMLHINKLRVH